VFPQSLKKLTLGEYKKLSKPFVLPNQLEHLDIHFFRGPLELNVLPTSLTRLEFPGFRPEAIFSYVDQLNNLNLDIFILTQ